MSRLGEEIKGRQRRQAVASIDEDSEITGEGRRVAGDVEYFLRQKPSQGGKDLRRGTAPRGIEDDCLKGSGGGRLKVVLCPPVKDGDGFHSVPLHVVLQVAGRGLPGFDGRDVTARRGQIGREAPYPTVKFKDRPLCPLSQRASHLFVEVFCLRRVDLKKGRQIHAQGEGAKALLYVGSP